MINFVKNIENENNMIADFLYFENRNKELTKIIVEGISPKE